MDYLYRFKTAPLTEQVKSELEILIYILCDQNEQKMIKFLNEGILKTNLVQTHSLFTEPDLDFA